MHTYIHVYIHACIYMHVYIHTYVEEGVVKGKEQTLKNCFGVRKYHKVLLRNTVLTKLKRCRSHYSTPSQRHLAFRQQNHREEKYIFTSRGPQGGHCHPEQKRVPYGQRFAILRAHTHDDFHIPLCGLVVLVKVTL